MVKTRRRQRKAKKTRKQRGAGQIFVKNPTRSRIPTTTLNFNETTTPRNLLKQYIDKTELAEDPDYQFYKFEKNPPFLFYLPPTYLDRFKNGWNKPWGNVATRGKKLQNQATYTLTFNEKLASLVKERRLEQIAITFALLQRILSLPAFQSGAKVLVGNFAVTGAIPKNVDQQFKFQKEPFSPIVHLDWAYFKNSYSGYDFYKYLKFQEFQYEEITNFLKEKGIDDPRSIVRFYKKPAGEAFTVNPNNISGEINAQKSEYLEEVYKQASETPDASLQESLLQKTDAEKREILIEFLKKKEILMCVVQHDTMVDNQDHPLSLEKYLKDKKEFPLYIWSEQ